jgi:hypothetical protein
MGYYPATLFNGGLAAASTGHICGGEVNTDLPNPGLTLDQMGSDWQAQGGWTRAAFLRNLRNQIDMSGEMVDYDGTVLDQTPVGVGGNPYTIQNFPASGTNWGSYCYVGRPLPPSRLTSAGADRATRAGCRRGS